MSPSFIQIEAFLLFRSPGFILRSFTAPHLRGVRFIGCRCGLNFQSTPVMFLHGDCNTWQDALDISFFAVIFFLFPSFSFLIKAEQEAVPATATLGGIQEEVC